MRFLALCVLAGLLSIMPAYAVDVTTCGQEVAAGGTGVLTGNLVCDGTTPGYCLCGTPSCYVDPDAPCTADADCSSNDCVRIAVRLRHPASLQLGGFSISGVVGDAPHHGIFCEGRCTIEGPGTVTNMLSRAIHVGERAGTGHADIRDLTVTDSHVGIAGVRLKLTNVTLTGHQQGIDARTLRVDNVTASSNLGVGLSAKRVAGEGLNTSDNGDAGVLATAARLRDFTALDNGKAGIFSFGHATLVDSTLTGNGFGDVATVLRPRLRNTTCGTSVIADPNGMTSLGTWGVCQGD